jgi:hypothetical protein
MLAIATRSPLSLAQVGDRNVSTGTIDGIVSDTMLAPIASATVSVLGTDLRVVTAADGRFRITQLRPGRYIIFARRLGFEMASATVQIIASDTARIAFALLQAVTQLEPTIITGRSLSPRLAEFEERRLFAAKFGGGQFMSQDEIDKRNTVFTTELIRTFSGIGVGYATAPGSGKKRVPVATSGRLAGSINLACLPTIWLDGVLLPGPVDLDGLPSPRELGGIEVYPGPATLPPRYAAGGMSCGTILIWTR